VFYLLHLDSQSVPLFQGWECQEGTLRKSSSGQLTETVEVFFIGTAFTTKPSLDERDTFGWWHT